MRLLMILSYFGVALLLGFYLRGRYDEFIYGTPHMQRRLPPMGLPGCCSRIRISAGDAVVDARRAGLSAGVVGRFRRGAGAAGQRAVGSWSSRRSAGRDSAQVDV